MPSITLTVDAATAQRIGAAFGRAWRLTDGNGQPRDATLPEVKDWLALQLKRVVKAQETDSAQAAAANVTEAVVS